ncbi:MAG: DUF4173 domain-containing protein, partial [Streptomycetaceae bacterium]|nr:DUF4173 domain-containing protein [Streptomycetaceae bacterium]
MPVPVVLLAAAAGAWTAATFRYSLGLNLLIAAGVAAVAAGLAWRKRGGRPEAWSVVWAVIGTAFAALPALRDDSWLHPYTTVAALGFGSMALTGPVGWRAVLARPFAVTGAMRAGVVWGIRGLLRRVARRTPSAAWIIGALLAGTCVLVFGGLFAAADAVVAELLDQAVRAVTPESEPLRYVLGATAFALTLGAARVASRARPAETAPPHRGLRTVEWALPLLLLNLVFAVFVYVQIAVVLFDGYHDVLRRKGVNYADYARQGFFTLLVVTALTLAVVAIASRFGPARGDRHRRLFEGLLGTLCALALAVVVAALHRLELYVDHSGLTRLRICAATLEIWLGVLFVLILGTGPWAAAARQLPRLAAASGAAILLTLGLLSPDALIARVGVDRQRDTGVVDVRDLAGLSADAVPWLDKLPEPQRSCLLRPIARDLAHGHDAWYETNR